MNPSNPLSRADWRKRLFPGGVPSLWCPPLTHYRADGSIDRSRITAHLRWMSPWVKGWLVPGSTGDGWELSETETAELLDLVLELAPTLDAHLLIGALHPDASEARRLISVRMDKVRARCPHGDTPEVLAQTHVCGFAVCPPRGADLSQSEIRSALSDILGLNLPIALYQLPQVTQNEMSAETASVLAAAFHNFIMFKDTSGRDKVALSALKLPDVFLVRGMEGDYARWLKCANGPYNGFLLASANCFPRQLQEIRVSLEEGRATEAQALSQTISDLISAVFDLVKALPDGNMFANGGKALDHFFAHGPEARELPPPRLHSGRTLPREIIKQTGAVLSGAELMPESGYLET